MTARSRPEGEPVASTARSKEAGARSSETVEPLANYFVGRLKRDLRQGNTQVGVGLTTMHRALEGLVDALETELPREERLSPGERSALVQSLPTDLLAEVGELRGQAATRRMQEIYSEPIKPELIAKRVKEIKDQGVVTAASLTPQRVKEKLELVREKDGSMNWYATTKVPLRDNRGLVMEELSNGSTAKWVADADAHDLQVAWTSHLPQAAASALERLGAVRSVSTPDDLFFAGCITRSYLVRHAQGTSRWMLKWRRGSDGWYLKDLAVSRS